MKALPIRKQKAALKSKESATESVKKIRKSVTPNTSSRTKRSSSPLVRKMKRYGKQTLRSMLLSHTFHTTFKIAVGVIISSGLFYGSYLVIGKSFANEIVISKSEIVARVSKLTTLPEEEPYDIVRVQDPENLMKQNEFYKDIQEGDYILMYSNMAVIYNLRSNQIVAIKRGN